MPKLHDITLLDYTTRVRLGLGLKATVVSQPGGETVSKGVEDAEKTPLA